MLELNENDFSKLLEVKGSEKEKLSDSMEIQFERIPFNSKVLSGMIWIYIPPPQHDMKHV